MCINVLNLSQSWVAANFCGLFIFLFLRTCLVLILFGFVFLLFAEGIFRAQLLELEKENSQANGVSKFTCTCVLYACSVEVQYLPDFTQY